MGGMVHGAGCGPCAHLFFPPHSVSQSGIALRLHHVITLVCNYHNNELFILGVGLEHGTRGLDKREFVGGRCYCSKVTCLNKDWYPVRREYSPRTNIIFLDILLP